MFQEHLRPFSGETSPEELILQILLFNYWDLGSQNQAATAQKSLIFLPEILNLVSSPNITGSENTFNVKYQYKMQMP
jgi:hypothetical protein